MKEFIQILITGAGVLLVIGMVILLLGLILNMIRTNNFHKRIKVGTPVRLDEEIDNKGGWYVVKSRTENRVELVRLAPDNTGKDVTGLETEYECDVTFCKPL